MEWKTPKLITPKVGTPKRENIENGTPNIGKIGKLINLTPISDADQSSLGLLPDSALVGACSPAVDQLTFLGNANSNLALGASQEADSGSGANSDSLGTLNLLEFTTINTQPLNCINDNDLI